MALPTLRAARPLGTLRPVRAGEGRTRCVDAECRAMARLPDGVSYYRDDFIINSRKQTEIDEAVALARRNWRRFDELDAASPSDHAALLHFSEQVTLPLGYRLAISVQEWPAQLKWYQRSPRYDRRYHLVLSIDDNPGTVPPPAAFAKVLRACRHNDDPPDKVWVQDYECYGGKSDRSQK